MKTVFSNNEVAHVWARQSQENGRSSNGTIWFEGTKIYSYGRHFCMGNILPNGKVLITNRSYSNTTAKHLGTVRYAVNHKETVYCRNPEGSVTENLNDFVRQLQNELSDHTNTRKRPHTRERALVNMGSIAQNVVKYAEAIGETIESIQSLNPDFLQLYEFALNQDINKLNATLQRQREKKERLDRELQLEAEKKAKKDIIKWKNGQSVYVSNLPKVYLRINGDRIETSKGAQVTIRSASVLFQMIQQGKNIKDHVIDHYTVTGINGVLTIGCHKIERSEINRIAKLLKWGKI